MDLSRTSLLGRSLQSGIEIAHARARVPIRERVVFVVGEHNLRSQKALEKIGARLVGPALPHECVPAPKVVFAITREEFGSGRIGSA